MKLSLGHPIHLSYCTNVHPAETWTETLAGLAEHTLKIREHAAPGRPFGLGLWLSNQASLELESPSALDAFKSFLARNDLYVFTLNGFPYGRFHGTRIKENVFAPDWARPERLAYTKRLADLLARLMPEETEGSISTLPGSFKEWITAPDQVTAIVENLADCALHLAKLESRTGRRIHLGLEPEPMGYIETIEETARFFTGSLRSEGARHLESKHGLSLDEADSAIREHVGVCYDTCHMAVEYEDAAAALARLAKEEILISKVQISSALRLTPTEEGLRELERFEDGVYLHQAIAREQNGELVRWRDIGPALADRARLMQAEEIRVHCHVPLYMRSHRGLDSTSDHVTDLLACLKKQNPVSHFEIETYTWDVLPRELRRAELHEAIGDEFRWFLEKLNAIENQDPSPGR